MISAQDFETSVITNSPSQDSFHPADQIPSSYVTSGFKPFSIVGTVLSHRSAYYFFFPKTGGFILKYLNKEASAKLLFGYKLPTFFSGNVLMTITL